MKKSHTINHWAHSSFSNTQHTAVCGEARDCHYDHKTRVLHNYIIYKRKYVTCHKCLQWLNMEDLRYVDLDNHHGGY